MKSLRTIMGISGMAFALNGNAALPPDYQGKPFEDAIYKGGPQVIPGKVECAYYDLGGEGVAYHDYGQHAQMEQSRSGHHHFFRNRPAITHPSLQ